MFVIMQVFEFKEKKSKTNVKCSYVYGQSLIKYSFKQIQVMGFILCCELLCVLVEVWKLQIGEGCETSKVTIIHNIIFVSMVW